MATSKWIYTLLPEALQKETISAQLSSIHDHLLSEYADVELKEWMKICKEAWLRNNPSKAPPPRAISEWNVFVKTCYPEVKKLHPSNDFKENIKIVSAMYQVQKAQKEQPTKSGKSGKSVKPIPLDTTESHKVHPEESHKVTLDELLKATAAKIEDSDPESGPLNWNLFLKLHMEEVKSNNPGNSFNDNQKIISILYKEYKEKFGSDETGQLGPRRKVKAKAGMRS